MDLLHRKILTLLKHSNIKNQRLTINQIAESLNIDRHTAAKHLESMRSKGLIDYKNVAKSKIWSINNKPLISKNTDSIDYLAINNFKEIIKNVDENISIQDKNFNVLWNNKKNMQNLNIKFAKCHSIHAGRLDKCKIGRAHV